MNGSNVGVALVLGLGAFTLLYGAIKGFDPRSLFTSVFTGDEPTSLAPLPGQDAPSGMTGGRPPGAAGATPAAAKFAADMKGRYGSALRAVGIVSVRKIAGTNTWSQHAYGNAVDITANPETLRAIWARSILTSGSYGIRTIIYNRKAWSSGVIKPYTGVNPHTDHIHVDFKPQYCGEPPGRPCG